MRREPNRETTQLLPLHNGPNEGGGGVWSGSEPSYTRSVTGPDVDT